LNLSSKFARIEHSAFTSAFSTQHSELTKWEVATATDWTTEVGHA
jgi:hypothetical protein